jgi:hypothetical protein
MPRKPNSQSDDADGKHVERILTRLETARADMVAKLDGISADRKSAIVAECFCRNPSRRMCECGSSLSLHWRTQNGEAEI